MINENRFFKLCNYTGKLVITLFSIFYFNHCIGQEAKSGKISPLFSSNELICFTLKGDLKTAISDVGDNRTNHAAVIEYVENEDTIRLNVQIHTRGNFRRNHENCNFPPFSINFRKKEVKKTLFEGINKIKLVTHCKSGSKIYQQYVLEEYLIYRTFNIITDTSYRVRLALVTYYDTVSEKVLQKSYSILIEPDGAFEDRLRLKEFEKKYVLQDKTKYDHVSKLAVFEYMIGNTDWAVSTLHNVKLFTADTTQPAYAIPYDFDWSGVINAMYAKPLPRFETKSVTERVFRGYCRSLAQFKSTFEFFNSKKIEIYSLYQNFGLLKTGERKRIIRYLDDFYKIIGNDRRIKAEFLDGCINAN
jgi:hypothetical protein